MLVAQAWCPALYPSAAGNCRRRKPPPQSCLRTHTVVCLPTCTSYTHIIIINFVPGVVAHTFKSSTQETEAVNLYEFEASLVYIMSSRTARTIH